MLIDKESTAIFIHCDDNEIPVVFHQLSIGGYQVMKQMQMLRFFVPERKSNLLLEGGHNYTEWKNGGNPTGKEAEKK